MKNVFKLVLYLRNAIKIFVILFRDKIKKIYRKSIKHRNKKLTNKYVIISLGSFILVLFPFDSTEKKTFTHTYIYIQTLCQMTQQIIIILYSLWCCCRKQTKIRALQNKNKNYLAASCNCLVTMTTAGNNKQALMVKFHLFFNSHKEMKLLSVLELESKKNCHEVMMTALEIRCVMSSQLNKGKKN